MIGESFCQNYTESFLGNLSPLKFLMQNCHTSCKIQHKEWQWFCKVNIRLAHWLLTHTHTHPFNGPFSGTTWVSQYQKGKTNLDFTDARDSEWQWHQLGHMQVCNSLQTDNHAGTPPLRWLLIRWILPDDDIDARRATDDVVAGTTTSSSSHTTVQQHR